MANSQNMTTSNGYIIYWIESYINSQSGNSSNIQVKVWCKRTNEGYTTYGNGTIYLNVDGQTRQSSITNSQTLTSTARLLHDESYTINHNSDGTKSIYIQAYISHDRFSSSWQGWTYTLTPISVIKIPGAPSNLSLTGRFDNGMSTTLTWTKGSGTITAYEIQRRFWKAYNNSYTDYAIVNSNYDGGATSITIQHSAVGDHAQQVRIRAKNSAGYSNWVESNWVYHDGVNIFTNTSGGKTYGKVKVWNGTTWKQAYVSLWNGSGWTTTK